MAWDKVITLLDQFWKCNTIFYLILLHSMCDCKNESFLDSNMCLAFFFSIEHKICVYTYIVIFMIIDDLLIGEIGLGHIVYLDGYQNIACHAIP